MKQRKNGGVTPANVMIFPMRVTRQLGDWPEKGERNARLAECAGIVRRLLGGERVTHHGRVTVVEAEIHSRPATPPPLLGAAVTEATAGLVGGWADGLLTVSGEPEQVRRVVEAFRRGGGEGKRLVLQAGLSWAPTEDEALHIAHDQWRGNVFAPPVCWDLETVEHFDEVGEDVPPERVRDSVLVSSDLVQHAAWLHELARAEHAKA
mgnify:CR=1 FL=1